MKTLMTTLVLALMSLGAHAQADNLSPLQELTINDGRTILVGPNQMTVYTFDIDMEGSSECYEECAKAWPPVLINQNQQVSSPLGTTRRRDGKIQLTYNNHPIYFFKDDKKVGDIKGDKLNEVWHIIVR